MTFAHPCEIGSGLHLPQLCPPSYMAFSNCFNFIAASLVHYLFNIWNFWVISIVTIVAQLQRGDLYNQNASQNVDTDMTTTLCSRLLRCALCKETAESLLKACPACLETFCDTCSGKAAFPTKSQSQRTQLQACPCCQRRTQFQAIKDISHVVARLHNDLTHASLDCAICYDMAMPPYCD
jgi:hypothetical protein